MNELLDTYALLANAILDDPFLALANAVVWLDPLGEMPDDYEYEEGNDAEMALFITRSVFPGIYAGVVEQIRAGVTYAQLDSFICREINQCGIPLDDLEYMAYGIPLPAHGVELAEPELYAARPDLARLLGLFGIRPEPEAYHVEIPDNAYKAGWRLANSLMKQEDERWQQVGWALAWLFSCSGNSLIDCNDESLGEIPPLPWDVENLDFAIEMIEEAEEILKGAEAGVTLLEKYPDVFRTLSENVNRVYQTLAKLKEKNREPSIRLEWPPLDRGADGATVTDVELLQLRSDAAQA